MCAHYAILLYFLLFNDPMMKEPMEANGGEFTPVGKRALRFSPISKKGGSATAVPSPPTAHWTKWGLRP